MIWGLGIVLGNDLSEFEDSQSFFGYLEFAFRTFHAKLLAISFPQVVIICCNGKNKFTANILSSRTGGLTAIDKLPTRWADNASVSKLRHYVEGIESRGLRLSP